MTKTDMKSEKGEQEKKGTKQTPRRGLTREEMEGLEREYSG